MTRWNNSDTHPPEDLQVCIGWDEDVLEPVFVQWLDGPKQFVDATVAWQDSVRQWRPLTDQPDHTQEPRTPGDGKPPAQG